MGIPAADLWVCPECQEASDPDLWVTEQVGIQWSGSPASRQPICRLWCPECGLGFAGTSGAREIARRTLAQIGDEAVVDPAVGSALLSPLSGAA
jgi:hypothetical protein